MWFVFAILAGIATGVSWLYYDKVLQMGEASIYLNLFVGELNKEVSQYLRRDYLYEFFYNRQEIYVCYRQYVRSGVPENLTEKEIQWLLDHKMLTIIDL